MRTTSSSDRKIDNSPHSRSQNAGESRFGKDVKRVTPPFPRRKSSEQDEKMFSLFESKAEVEILNSTEDDMLAASMYGGVKKSKRKKQSKKQERRISGYNFDALLKDESSSFSTTSDFHESFGKYS